MNTNFARIAALGLALAVTGCDLDQLDQRGREGMEPPGQAEPPDQPRDAEAGFEQQLESVDQWVTDTRRRLDEAGPEARQDLRQEVDRIERDANELRSRLRQMDPETELEQFSSDFNRIMSDITASMDRVESELNQASGAPTGAG